jgi:hypothetical protein
MLDTNAIIRVYRGWDKLEKSNDLQIIDHDLVSSLGGSDKLKSRKEVLERLQILHKSAKPENEQEEYIKAKLNASIYYLRALMGENIPYYEYVENIIGVSPQLIPEEEIQKQRKIMEGLLREVGHNHEEEDATDFVSKLIISKNDAEKEIKQCEEILIPLFLEVLEIGDLRFQHKIQFVESRDYWKGWATTTPEGTFLLRYNFHPINRWYRGDVEALTVHEVCGHFIRAMLLKKGIENGELNPVLGITTVQEPRVFIDEGVADALAYFLPEIWKALSIYGKLAREQITLRYYLENNAHIWINEGGNSEELIKYILNNNPFTTEDKVRMNLENWKNNPSRRAYPYVYGISLYTHRQWQQKLSHAKQKEYLIYALTHEHPPVQLMRFVNHLIQA